MGLQKHQAERNASGKHKEVHNQVLDAVSLCLPKHLHWQDMHVGAWDMLLSCPDKAREFVSMYCKICWTCTNHKKCCECESI